MLTRIDNKTKPLKVITKRKISWLCHILRRNCLQLTIVEGKRERRRRNVRMLDDIRNGKSSSKMRTTQAQDKDKWRASC